MQSNIVEMFPSSGADGFFYNTLPRMARYTQGSYYPITFRSDPPEKRSMMKDMLMAMIESAAPQLELLDQESLSFMEKFEEILRMYYRFCRFNPELVLLYEDVVLKQDSQKDSEIRLAVAIMEDRIRGLLRHQVRNNSVLAEENSLEQVVLFTLMEILRLFQEELTHCCREMVDTDYGIVFPAEEQMMRRYYHPLAEQLEGLIPI